MGLSLCSSYTDFGATVCLEFIPQIMKTVSCTVLYMTCLYPDSYKNKEPPTNMICCVTQCTVSAPLLLGTKPGQGIFCCKHMPCAKTRDLGLLIKVYRTHPEVCLLALHAAVTEPMLPFLPTAHFLILSTGLPVLQGSPGGVLVLEKSLCFCFSSFLLWMTSG